MGYRDFLQVPEAEPLIFPLRFHERERDKVILYMTLITAMLVMIYKRENEMGYTIGKFSFFMEMQDWIVKLMATLQNEKLSLLAYEDMKLRARIP